MIVYTVLDNRYLAEEAYLQSWLSMTDRQQQQAYGPLIIISLYTNKTLRPKFNSISPPKHTSLPRLPHNPPIHFNSSIHMHLKSLPLALGN